MYIRIMCGDVCTNIGSFSNSNFYQNKCFKKIPRGENNLCLNGILFQEHIQ